MSLRSKSLNQVAQQGVEAESERLAKRFQRAEQTIKQTQLPEQGSEPVNLAPPPIVSKPKVKKETFTIPPGELDELEKIRQRLRMMNVDNVKGEVYRAGIVALAQMDDKELKTTFEQVEKIRGGRKGNN